MAEEIVYQRSKLQTTVECLSPLEDDERNTFGRLLVLDGFADTTMWRHFSGLSSSVFQRHLTALITKGFVERVELDSGVELDDELDDGAEIYQITDAWINIVDTDVVHHPRK